jgi:hypothetical protein
MHLSDIVALGGIVLFITAVIVTAYALGKGRMAGFTFGVLAIIGAVICFIYLPVATGVAEEGHLFSADFFVLSSRGPGGLALVLGGCYFALRRKKL